MSGYLTRMEMNEIVAGLGSWEGEQRHINHEQCPAGHDTKKRMYVTRKGDAVLFYCHHCQQRGVLKNHGTVRAEDALKRMTTRTVAMLTPSEISPTAHMDGWSNVVDWPRCAVSWWYKYGLDNLDALKYGVLFSPYDNRLWLYAPGKGYQGRGFAELGTHEPKYLTRFFNDNPVLLRQFPQRNVLFIVEDLVSAYKIHKAGCDVMCCTGTSIKDSDVSIATLWDNVVVWYDPDAAGRVSSVKTLKRLLNNKKYNFTIDVHRLPAFQPKDATVDFIKQLEAEYA